MCYNVLVNLFDYISTMAKLNGSVNYILQYKYCACAIVHLLQHDSLMIHLSKFEKKISVILVMPRFYKLFYVLCYFIIYRDRYLHIFGFK